jgi:glutathione S-transferase
MHPKDFQDKNIRNSENNFHKCCNFLDNILQTQSYLLGENITYAEMIVLGSLTWGEKVSGNTKIEKKFERLRAWKDELDISLNN